MLTCNRGLLLHARLSWQQVGDSDRRISKRSLKLSRSLSSLNIFRRSMPLMITWCRMPGASIRACLGMRL